MDITTILATAQTIIKVANMAMQVGEDIEPFVKSAYQVLVEKKPLSITDREQLLAEEKRLRDILQQPETD